MGEHVEIGRALTYMQAKVSQFRNTELVGPFSAYFYDEPEGVSG